MSKTNIENNPTDSKFVKVLKEAMRKRNFTQLAIANEIGVRQSQLSNWLNGRTLPNYSTLQLLKDKLNVCVEDFFD